jgi:hypothetical protein
VPANDDPMRRGTALLSHTCVWCAIAYTVGLTTQLPLQGSAAVSTAWPMPTLESGVGREKGRGANPAPGGSE